MVPEHMLKLRIFTIGKVLNFKSPHFKFVVVYISTRSSTYLLPYIIKNKLRSKLCNNIRHLLK